VQQTGPLYQVYNYPTFYYIEWGYTSAINLTSLLSVQLSYILIDCRGMLV